MPTLFSRLLAPALYGLPRPLLRPRGPMERLRSYSFSERMRSKGAPVRFARTLYALSVYPIAALVESMRNVQHLRRKNSTASKGESVRMAMLALLRNVPPTEYAVYEFNRAEVRAAAGEYLYWTDAPALLWLNRQRGADNRDVQDKARFAAVCAQSDLPHVAVLAEFRDGKQVSGEAVEQLAGTRFWIKPVNLNGGRGGAGWTREGDSCRDDAGGVLTQQQWLSYLRGRECIVQPRLRNHPEIEPITNGALAAIRLNTVVDRSGSAELIGAMLGLPFGSYSTTTGGIGAAIEAATGTVFNAYHPSVDLANGHPDTGIPIVGRQTPYWNETVDLALRAHRTAFPKFASLGWDVVVTPDGPLLLEANSGWGAMGQQIFFGPLGKTAFSRIVQEELDLAR